MLIAPVNVENGRIHIGIQPFFAQLRNHLIRAHREVLIPKPIQFGNPKVIARVENLIAFTVHHIVTEKGGPEKIRIGQEVDYASVIHIGVPVQ